MSKLPIDLSDIMSAVSKGTKQGKKTIKVMLYVGSTCSHAFVETLKALFTPAGESVEFHVKPFVKTPPAPDRKTDVVLVAAGNEPGAAMYVQSLRVAEYDAMLMTDDVAGLADACEREGFELDLDSLVFFDTFASDTIPTFRADVADWIIDNMDRQRFPFACAFPFMVEPLENELINATAIQNAVVGAVPLIKGADLPIMTANQIKLLIEIAILHGFKIEASRAAEIAVVVASGLGLRAIARALQGKIPVLDFAVRGLVGYAGTYCIGNFTANYFAQGGSLDGLAGALRSAKDDIIGGVETIKDQLPDGVTEMIPFVSSR